MPTTNPPLRLFGQSPFKPLQEHMRVVVQCANEVPRLFEALQSGDQAQLTTIRDRIFALESEADDIKNQMRAHLPRSLFMPVDRRDLLEILDLQDSIADTAQDIAGMLVVRKMEFPEPMQQPLLALTRRCVDACDQMAAIMEELGIDLEGLNLSELGRGKKVTIDKDTTTIVEGGGKTKDIQGRIGMIRSQIEGSSSAKSRSCAVAPSTWLANSHQWLW